MKSSLNLLFVCLGNICRSPAAENVFRHLVEEAGLSHRINCASVGTIDLQAGKSPDPRMSKTLGGRGYRVTGKARAITPADLDHFDLILAMDRQNKADVLRLAKTPEQKNKVRAFTDFCRDHSHSEVPDPYEGDEEDFLLVVDLIEDGARGLLNHLTWNQTEHARKP